MNPDAEFEQWYDAEIVGWPEKRMEPRDIARLAFQAGYTLAHEGRA